MPDRDSLEAAQAENARLIALLETNSVVWKLPPAPVSPGPWPEPSPRSVDEKVTLFRRLFRGRTDVFATRWESTATGRSGYAPACANEWRPGVCEKPRIKCSACQHRAFIPLSDKAIYDHRVSGAATITVTKNEILYSLNKPDDFILAIVEFTGDDTHRAHYLRRPFQREPDFGVTSVNYDFADLLERAEPPR